MDAKSGIESSCESLFHNKEYDYRSPESSDCEGYATPLATSRCDLSATSNKMISVIVPEDDENFGNAQDSRELTPVGQTDPRAESPPVITQVMFLEKPKILVMTQKHVDELETTVDKKFVEESRNPQVDELVNVESSPETEPETTIKTDESLQTATLVDINKKNMHPVTEIEEKTNSNIDSSIDSIDKPCQSNKLESTEENTSDSDISTDINLINNEQTATTTINLNSEFEKVENVIESSPPTNENSPLTKTGNTANLINAFETLTKETEVDSIPLQQPAKIPLVEKYPSNTLQTAEDVTDVEIQNQVDSREEIMAMQKVSAEVEQLVADINALQQRGEEEQKEGKEEKQPEEEEEKDGISATEVVMKKIEIPETENMSDNELERCLDVSEDIPTVAFHDQTIQTDDGDLILVDRWMPEVMETLRMENERLRSQLENLTIEGVEELNKHISNLQKQLSEANHTIDEIEVEAEQQYTEMTSEIDELCELVMKKDGELAALKENVAKLTSNEFHWKDDVESQKSIVQRQKEVIEGLREDLENQAAKLVEMTRLRDRAAEEATLNRMKNQEKESFLAKEAQMSLEVEDLQRELNKQKLILNQTSMAKLADTFERKVLKLENDVRERDMLICKQNQIINRERKSPNGQSNTKKQYQSRAATLAAESGPSAGSSSESFQHGLDLEAKETILGFLLSDRYNQLANIYNIGRILDLNMQEERSLERHLTKDRFT